MHLISCAGIDELEAKIETSWPVMLMRHATEL